MRTTLACLTFLVIATAYIAPAAAETCRPWSNAEQTGKLANKEIDESSGLAASRRHPDLLWTHNDSGDEARLFLMERDGSHIAEVSLENAVDEAKDVEDVAVGPCKAGSDESCVFVGDIGDNKKKRDEVVIYRFPEPALAENRPVTIKLHEVDAIWFRYPKGPRDAETLMVHPKTATPYIVEKVGSGESKVFEVPHEPTARQEPHAARERGQLRLSSSSGFDNMATAGDIAPNGREFTIRTYLSTYIFCVEEGEDFEKAFGAEPTRTRTPLMIQSEALAYGLEGRSIFLTSEGRGAGMWRLER